MFDLAYAAGQTPQGEGSPLQMLIPIVLMFVIFYFLLIRPQQKKAKEHQEMINNLKKGDRVITSGGIHGTITSLDENAVTVEIADKVRVKVTRGSIAGLHQPAQSDSQKTEQNA